MPAYFKVPFIYFIVGVVWIVTSDAAVENLAPTLSSLTHFQTAKGWFYVVVSSLLLCALMKRYHRRHLAQEAERQDLIRQAIAGAHHILRNYLNQMQLVTLEAEHCAGFDQATIAIAHEASDEAAKALAQLEALHCASSPGEPAPSSSQTRREGGSTA